MTTEKPLDLGGLRSLEEFPPNEESVIRQKNNIGIMRLVLASLVIVGHSPEIIDGDRHREPLTAIFHTLSLGEIAVDAFFLISGYLITKSMLESPTTLTYLYRRVMRIYPAFLVATLLSLVVMVPFFGGHVTSPLRTLLRAILLQTPHEDVGRLAALPYPALNGSMWTIAYEFRCYLLIAVLGICGVLTHRRAILALVVLFACGTVAETFPGVRAWSDGVDTSLGLQVLIGGLASTMRLTFVFLVGACFYTFRDFLIPRLSGRLAGLFTFALLLILLNGHLAELGATLLGGYALFWLAFRANLGKLQHINNRWDISYGVYLYGWPVAIMIAWTDRAINPWLLTTLALALSCAFGAASWWGLERRMNDIARPRRRVPANTGAAGGVSSDVTKTGFDDIKIR